MSRKTDYEKIQTLGRDKAYPGKEDDLQKSVSAMIGYKYPKAIWWHTPNGGKRNGREAAKFKKMGVKAGVPDILIFTPNKSHNGLAIELKARGGRLQDSQKKTLNHLFWCGWQVVVCYNLDAVEAICSEYFDC